MHFGAYRMLNCVIKESGDGMTVLEFLFVFYIGMGLGIFSIWIIQSVPIKIYARAAYETVFYSMTINA